MSKNIRIIPRLDIKGPNLVKGIHLEGLRVLGKPEDFARYFYEMGADELVYMDVVATSLACVLTPCRLHLWLMTRFPILATSLLVMTQYPFARNLSGGPLSLAGTVSKPRESPFVNMRCVLTHHRWTEVLSLVVSSGYARSSRCLLVMSLHSSMSSCRPRTCTEFVLAQCSLLASRQK